MRQDYFYVPAPKGERSSEEEPLAVNCAGETDTEGVFETILPNGRADYTYYYIFENGMEFSFAGAPFLPVKEGSVVVIPPRLSLTYRHTNTDRLRLYWVHFTGKDVGALLAANDIPADGGIFTAPVTPRILEEFQTLLDGMKGLADACARIRTAAALVQVMTTVTGERRREEKHGRLSRSITYLHEHYTEPIEKEFLAATEGLSLSQYNLCFRRLTGYSPAEYMTLLRMKSAERLLCETALPIAEVARRCGYDDAYYFSRVFHRTHGCSPLAFRGKKEV